MIHRPWIPLLATLLVASTLDAQQPKVIPPTVFAIKNVKAVPEPGKVIDNATLVIRDGVITAIGADVEAPVDALVIDGKGLIAYPGFIDAMSNWGFDNDKRKPAGGPPAQEDIASEALVATKPDNRKGMTPEFEVRNALKSDKGLSEKYRKVGVTAHLIAPEGGFVVGQSALISLSETAPRESLLKPNAALHLAFRNLGGSEYPRALMGVIAHTRQAFLDAQHYARIWDRFEKGGRVGKRPPSDPALEALSNVMKNKTPVVFEADSLDEIHRALNFAKEFKLRPIIYGGQDAWKVVDRLKEENVPVLLRVDFVERKSEQPMPKRTVEDEKRKQLEIQACASKLQQAGILFAISTQGQGDKEPGKKFRENLLKAIKAGLKPEDALRAMTISSAKILGVDRQLGTLAVGKAAHVILMTDEFQNKDAQVKYAFVDGIRFEHELKDKKEKKEEKEASDKPARRASEREDTPEKKPEPNYATELESDRKPKTQTKGNVLIRSATLYTITDGVKKDTDILIRQGRITRIGKNLQAPKGVTVINAKGMHVMPGIIDTHCHFSISGGVNEYSLSVVPEVGVRDVVNSEDVSIYRGLAGGLTTGRLLHGSANVIGGQDAVIKLKYGEPAHDLVLHDAPRGVKFALGENVKRRDGRFPNSRLGVEAVLIRAFTEARNYQKKWNQYRDSLKEKRALPMVEPRRDLRLEALVDVLEGRLKVHCHCYRADEILMLMRVADKFGFKVQSLQHVLEGYKIAAEIADHGASCSTFSDWWAYKIEAFDAIPFNSAVLHKAGATVCLKSDSTELMRHMYQEAAKCVKYGGMSETDALKTITLNGAKQLGLEKRIGSLEEGKDGDLAIFNGHPLNSYSRVEMTIIEGEVYFQRDEKLTPLDIAQAAPAEPGMKFTMPKRSVKNHYAITNVTVHPVTGPMVKAGTVIVKDGKIVQVLKGKADLGPQVKVIDATGLHLYPGMIDAATILGLTELGSAKETQDYRDSGDFQPDLKASTAINPDSALIPVTRANGVTSVVTRPVGSVIAGQSAFINLEGWVPREMTVKDPLALNVTFPTIFSGFRTSPDGPNLGRAVQKRQREEKIRRLKLLFKQAKRYAAAREQSSDTPMNPRLEAIVPYVHGEKPVVIEVKRKPEILEALKLADELKIKIVLSGAIDAWKVADEIKKRDVPVILGAIMSLPTDKTDPYDAPYASAKKLKEVGVRFCIRSKGGTNTRNLPYEAAMAVSYGLSPEEALKAVTLYPAQIFGLGKELGSIEKGKRANLVLTNGDPLQASTQVLGLFINGKPLSPVSKHTKLYERYLQRLKEVQSGQSPLGTK